MNTELKAALAEHQEEVRTGVKDALAFGAGIREVMQEAAAYGVNPEDVAQVSQGEKFIVELSPEERVRGFHSLIGSRIGSTIQMEDQDGEYRKWEELSPAGRLGNLAADAAYYGVPHEAFAEAAKAMVGGDLLDASLRVAFANELELTAIARELPDDGRTEPTPLPEKVRDVMAELDHAQKFIERHQEQEGIER